MPLASGHTAGECWWISERIRLSLPARRAERRVDVCVRQAGLLVDRPKNLVVTVGVSSLALTSAALGQLHLNVRRSQQPCARRRHLNFEILHNADFR